MSQASVPEVECSCGRVLRLPGATPGRVGRCPACGASFRVEAWHLAGTRTKTTTIRERPPIKAEADESAAGGYQIAPDTNAEPASPMLAGFEVPPDATRGRAAHASRTVGRGAVGRGGLIPLPKKPEQTLLGSLRYPIWDGMGLMALVLLPPPLAVCSIIVFGVLPWAIREGGLMLLVVPITIGFVVVFGVALGYAMATCSAVLIASTRGEVHHPRWPEVSLGAIASAAFRWGVAWGIGVGGMALILNWVWPARESAPFFEHLLRAELLCMGGIYSLVAMLAIHLHDDVTAARPTRVLCAIWNMGVRLLAVWLLFACAVAIGVALVAMVHRASSHGIPMLLGAAWVSWAFAIYAGLVLSRALGRAYQRSSKAVGWFRSKRRRYESALEPNFDQATAPEV